FETKMFEEVWSHNPTAFFKEKLAENTERHARAGDSVYLLQPQLKEGQGGLRDLHTALWMAKVRFKIRSFRELVTLGQMAERDVVELDPSVVVQVFADAQRHGVTLAPATRELIRDCLALLAAHHDQAAVAAAFLDILRAKGHVDETLFEMHKLGVLKTVIPEFANL